MIKYDKNGQETDITTPDIVCAQAEETESDIRYYVKVHRGGANSGQLFNPLGPYSSSTTSQLFQFRKVGKKCFENYVDFLRTRKNILLNQAQKEL